MKRDEFPKIYKSGNINETNLVWINEYKSSTNYKKNYYAFIENFFKYPEFENKTFNTFTVIPDIQKYVNLRQECLSKAATINLIISALSGFKNFLIENHPATFNNHFLEDLDMLRQGDINKSDAFILNLDQINKIREYNINDIRDEYIFEVFFQLGIDKKDITVCIPNNNDKEHSCFKINDVEIKYNAKISGLINKLPLDIKITPEIITYYLLRISTYLRDESVYDKVRSINYSDVIESHKMYIFVCPNCGEFTENISTNWVSVKRETDKVNRLFCKSCKGKRNEV